MRQLVLLATTATMAPGEPRCPCAASAPPGMADVLAPGDAAACGLLTRPATIYRVSLGACVVCAGMGCATCGGTGSKGYVEKPGAWRVCSRGHEWRPADAMRGRGRKAA